MQSHRRVPGFGVWAVVGGVAEAGSRARAADSHWCR
jgi:hypothetical protein